jgi:hypothetical protein
MDTLLFKVGTMIFVSGGTLAAFLVPGTDSDKASRCPTKTAVVSTVDQTSEECAKQKAAYAQCAKKKAEQMASAECAKKKAAAVAKAKSNCRYSQAATELAQNQDLPAEQTAEN